MDNNEDMDYYVEPIEVDGISVVPFRRPNDWKYYKPPEKKVTLWSPFFHEYHSVIDNPKKLPTILHPFIAKERAFTFGSEMPSYWNVPVDLKDQYGVHRRLHINICRENFVLGAVGATLISLATSRYGNVSTGRLGSFLAQRFLLGKPVTAFTRALWSTTLKTGSLSMYAATRGIAGGLGYDILKRSRDEDHLIQSWTNAAVAGGICGFAFGIRGGLPAACAAGVMGSAVAVTSEFAMKRNTSA